MPLQPQVFRMNMGQGLEQKTDSKTLGSGKMLVLQNAKFVVGNRLNKRDGFVAVGVPNASGQSIQRLDSFNGSVIGFGEGVPVTGMYPSATTPYVRSIYGYNSSLTVPTFTAQSPAFIDCQVTSARISTAQINSFEQSDSASVNGISLYAWRGRYSHGTLNNGVYYKFVDQASGRVLVPETLLVFTTPASVRCIAVGNALMLGYVDITATSIGVVAFDTANNLTQSTTTFTGVLAASTLFDWASYTTSGGAFVTLAYQSAAKSVALKKITAGCALSGSAAYTASNTVTQLCMVSPCPSTTSTTFYLAVSDSLPKLYSVPVSAAMVVGTPTASSFTIGTSPVIMTGQEISVRGSYYLYYNNITSITRPTITSSIYGVVVNTSGTFSIGIDQPLCGVSIHSKPIYRDDNNIYMWTMYSSLVQGQYLLAHMGYQYFGSIFYRFAPAARTLVGETMSATLGGATVTACNVSRIASDVYENACTVIGDSWADRVGPSVVPAMSKLNTRFGMTDQFATTTLNGQMILGGGFVGLYDGEQVTELGFFTYPDAVTVVAAAAFGFLSAGLYQYVAAYEWIDAQGNLHRSETSIPVSVTATVNTSTTVTFTYPPMTLKQSITPNFINQPSVVLYRTTANASPQIFYRVWDLAVGPAQPTSATINYNDTTADSQITANTILYTQGGVADNFTIDGTTVICALPDRLMAADPGNNGIVHVGIQYTQTVGLAFHSGITLLFPTADGPFTNMQYMDTTFVAFKGRSIYAVQGVGPTPNGQNNGFSQPQLITGEIGCVNPHAATLYPDGIIFQSAKGFYRLGRDLSFAPNTNYIGAAVESFNGLTCLRAVLRTDLNECRFLASDKQTILSYNYFFNQWSSIVTSANDMTVALDGSFYLANATPSNGALVVRESIGAFTDAALSSSPAGYAFNVTTGWCALNQLQGCQRIYRVRFLGDFKSTHTLQVEFAYDYEGGDSPTFAETHTISSANITSGSSVWQCEAFPLRQKCQSIAMRISDPSPSGESFDLTDIELEVGVMPGQRFPLASVKGF